MAISVDRTPIITRKMMVRVWDGNAKKMTLIERTISIHDQALPTPIENPALEDFVDLKAKEEDVAVEIFNRLVKVYPPATEIEYESGGPFFVPETLYLHEFFIEYHGPITLGGKTGYYGYLEKAIYRNYPQTTTEYAWRWRAHQVVDPGYLYGTDKFAPTGDSLYPFLLVRLPDPTIYGSTGTIQIYSYNRGASQWQAPHTQTHYCKSYHSGNWYSYDRVRCHPHFLSLFNRLIPDPDPYGFGFGWDMCSGLLPDPRLAETHEFFHHIGNHLGVTETEFFNYVFAVRPGNYPDCSMMTAYNTWYDDTRAPGWLLPYVASGDILTAGDEFNRSWFKLSVAQQPAIAYPITTQPQPPRKTSGGEGFGDVPNEQTPVEQFETLMAEGADGKIFHTTL